MNYGEKAAIDYFDKGRFPQRSPRHVREIDSSQSRAEHDVAGGVYNVTTILNKKTVYVRPNDRKLDTFRKLGERDKVCQKEDFAKKGIL